MLLFFILVSKIYKKSRGLYIFKQKSKVLNAHHQIHQFTYFDHIWSSKLKLKHKLFEILSNLRNNRCGQKTLLKTMKATLLDTLISQYLNYNYIWDKRTIRYFVPLPGPNTHFFKVPAHGLSYWKGTCVARVLRLANTSRIDSWSCLKSIKSPTIYLFEIWICNYLYLPYLYLRKNYRFRFTKDFLGLYI